MIGFTLQISLKPFSSELFSDLPMKSHFYIMVKMLEASDANSILYIAWIVRGLT